MARPLTLGTEGVIAKETFLVFVGTDKKLELPVDLETITRSEKYPAAMDMSLVMTDFCKMYPCEGCK